MRNIIFMLGIILLLYSGASLVYSQKQPLIDDLGVEADIFSPFLKAVVGAMPELVQLRSNIYPLPNKIDSEFFLSGCGVDAEDIGISYKESSYFPTSIAMDIVQFEASLKSLNIPESVWRTHLKQLTSLAVKYLTQTGDVLQYDRAYESKWWDLYDEAITLMLVDINSYVVVNQIGPPGMRILARSVDCGAGETPVEIKTNPVGALITYIPLFKFKLCEARNLDPLDKLACNGWVNAVKAREFLSGKYVYIAKWLDGISTTGIFNIDDFNANPDDSVHVFITR